MLRSVSATGYFLGQPVIFMKIAKRPVTDRTLFDIRLAIGAQPIGIWRKRGLGRFRACASLLHIPQLLTSTRCAFPAYLRVHTVLGSLGVFSYFYLIRVRHPAGLSPEEPTVALNRHQPVGDRVIELYTTTSLHFTQDRQYGEQRRRSDTGGRCVHNAPEERRRHE